MAEEFKKFTIDYGKVRLKVKRAELEKLQLLSATGPSQREEIETLRSAIDGIVAALKKVGVENV